MIYDTDGFDRDRSYNHNTLVVVLVVAKALRAASLYTSFGYLRLLNYPSTVWAWLLLAASSVVFTALQQPWRGRSIAPKDWAEIGAYSFLQGLQLVFYFVGLKYFGPLRTLLVSEFADITLVFVAGIFFSRTREKMHLNRKRGIVLLLLGYVLLFFVDAAPVPTGIAPGMATEFGFGSLTISASKAGFLCVLAAVCLTVLRKKMSKALSTSVGGAKRLNALSTVGSTVVLAPFALYSWVDASNVLSAGPWFHFFEALGFTVAVFMAVGYYVDTLVKPQLRSYEAMRYGLGSSVVACYLLEMWAGEITFSFFSLVAGACIFAGQHLVFKAPETSAYGKSLGSLDRPTGEGAFSGSLMDALTPLVSQLSQRIRTNKDARNIFIYLCLNLFFMFVEMAYGWWNNSLGLISDGFHMLFDCMALMIGLIALVISEWQPNQRYSYGYGRVNIMSGFINAVFLVFIACSVFYEALHRFVTPPEIHNDNLLLVSVLGLLVNMVGLFVFSQAHHAAHGHSHSHGSKKKDSGHGHSHGHHDEEEEQGHHGHSHGHDDHGHGHGHGHAHGDHDEHDDDDEHEDENMKGVFLHILGDTLGSVGVIVSSLCIEYLGWTIADPICSIIIACFIFTSVIPLLKSSATILLQVTPKKATKKLPRCLLRLQEIHGVQGYTEPHFWSPDGNEVVGTIHIQVDPDANTQQVLISARNVFAQSGIPQVTIQVDQAQEGVEALIQPTAW